jgi:hypothetical protein
MTTVNELRMAHGDRSPYCYIIGVCLRGGFEMNTWSTDERLRRHRDETARRAQ